MKIGESLQATAADAERELILDIDDLDDSECSPLHIAILKGRFLWISGCLPTPRDSSGCQKTFLKYLSSRSCSKATQRRLLL